MTAPRRSLLRWLHGHLVYPGIIYARGERELFPMLAELERLQWRPREELEQRQSRAVAALLSYAAAEVPFYRARLAGRAFTTGNALEQLREVPLLEKRDLQESRAELIAPGRPGRVTSKTTGGSTGQPVTLLKDRRATAAERAASWLGYGWFGIKPGDKGVRFWGSPATAGRRLQYAAADMAMNRLRFSAFAFDEEDLARYWKACVRARPDYFYGYVSMLEALAQYVVRSGDRSRWPQLKAVITTAEVLTAPQQQLMEEAFGAPVQNEYGCGEVGAIAYACRSGSLHLLTESQFVETLLPDGSAAGPGETGELVVTDLGNRAMPLIRYRVGDLGVLQAEPCECGRGFPVLARVWGREYDLVVAPDGRRYHGEFFMYLFEDLRAAGAPIRQFQVAQTAADQLEIRVVGGEEDFEGLASGIAAEFRRRLPGMTTSIQRVGALPRKASGKTAVVENDWARQNAKLRQP